MSVTNCAGVLAIINECKLLLCSQRLDTFIYHENNGRRV
jgi:hypothetical protein